MNEDRSKRDGDNFGVNDKRDICIHGSSVGDAGGLQHDSGGDTGRTGGEGVGIGDPSGSSEGGTVVALPTRRTRSGISRSHVELELVEHTKDLAAFKGAYSQVHARVIEVQDEDG